MVVLAKGPEEKEMSRVVFFAAILTFDCAAVVFFVSMAEHWSLAAFFIGFLILGNLDCVARADIITTCKRD